MFDFEKLDVYAKSCDFIKLIRDMVGKITRLDQSSKKMAIARLNQ